jgi:hypothetical protein
MIPKKLALRLDPRVDAGFGRDHPTKYLKWDD